MSDPVRKRGRPKNIHKGTVRNGEVPKTSDNNRSKLTLYNRVHGARLLTEPAVDALGHVDVCMSKANTVGSVYRTRHDEFHEP